MLAFWLILTLALLIFSHYLIRDFASPAFVLGAIWTAVYIIVILNKRFISDSTNCYYFFAAYLFFLIGFFVPMRKINLRRIKSVQSLQLNVYWNPLLCNSITIAEYLFSAIILATTLSNLISSGKSIWQTFRLTASENASSASKLVGILQNSVQIVFIVAFAIYLLNPVKRNKKMLLVSMPPAALTLLFSSRGDWFLILISCVFLFIFIKRPNGKKIARMGVTGVLLVLLVFFISSFDKYSDVNNYLKSSNEEIITGLTYSYFVAPPVSFLNWIKSNYEFANGKYIFRFVCALLHTVFPKIEVVNTVQPFANYVGVSSNVYTALHWYSIDFGFVGVCIVELILGYMYGKLYKNVRMNSTSSIIFIILLAMLMYNIVYQFFADQFLSIFSLWVQRFFWLLLIIKSPAIQIEKQY